MQLDSPHALERSSVSTVPLLQVTELKTYFHTRDAVLRAVDGVSFSIEAGEVVGLVGESGSGKSMTGFSLLGLIDAPGRIDGGSIRLRGRELVGLSPAEWRSIRGREIAMVFQDPMATLNPLLTIGEQIRLAIRAHERVGRKAAHDRGFEVLSRVGIPEARRRLDAWPHQLSGGMRQRVAIAIALLHRPALIVADEPTTALDVSIQAQILAEVQTLVSELGTALLWISHDLATVSALASRLLVMYAGRIVEEGPCSTVLREPRHPYTRGLLMSMPQFANPGEMLAQIPGTPPALSALPKGCAFSPRCQWVSEHCRKAVPERQSQPVDALAETASSLRGRAWRCHHPLG
jgi:peptide/nickel transport system ATP-binding protein